MSVATLQRPMTRLYVTALVCLCGAVAGAFLLYQDFISAGGRGLGQPLAQIESKVSSVRRKPSGSYLWSRAIPGESVYRKDSIQVGPQSSATVRFNDGQVLEVGENSLVIIDNLNDLTLNLKRGSFIVRTQTGDQRIRIDKKGNIEKENIPVRLLSPSTHAHFFIFMDGSARVELKWQPPQGEEATTSANAPFTLQISTHPRFLPNETRTIGVEAASGKTSIDLSPERYYWRLLKGAKPLTESRDFFVLQALPLQPLSPAAGQKFIQWEQASQTIFRWTYPIRDYASEYAEFSQHLIEVSSDTSFANPAIRQSINAPGGTARISKISPGKYYWRLRSQYGSEVATSAAQPFEIVATPKVVLTQSSPAKDAIGPVREELRFSWDAQGVEAEYLFELEKRGPNEFTQVLSKKGPSFSYLWAPPLPGVYRWRVIAYYEDRSVGETQWSQFTLFDGKPITLNSPVQTEILFWETAPEIAFSWNEEPVPPAVKTSYRLELSQDAEFTEVTRHYLTQTSSLTLPPNSLPHGKYFWRVKLQDTANNVWKISDTGDFYYGVHPPLRAPTNAIPNTGTVIDALHKKVEPVLQWDKVDGAVKYEISLKNEKTSITETAATPSFSLRGLNGGRYQWTVRAIDRLGRAGEGVPWREFTLQKESLKAPKKVIIEVQ